ncbi:MAG: GTPase Era [Candidatus Aminicenantia bacterium]
MAHKFGFVSIVGRPNVGKSTLLNNLVGSKMAIVSPKPQTTRVQIIAVKNLPDEQIVFLDSPGIHKPLHKMNERMMKHVFSSLEMADIILLMVDATQKFGKGDLYTISILEKIEKVRFLLLNKVDILSKELLLPMIDQWRKLLTFNEIIPISALKGTNLDTLQSLIVKYLPESGSLFGEESPKLPTKFFISEIIREKILHYTEEEIPYSAAVIVENVENKKNVIHIRATIIVDKESQKPIIIGKGGEMLKRIGTASRKELEFIFGMKVFLELWVRVEKGWRDMDEILDKLEAQE